MFVKTDDGIRLNIAIDGSQNGEPLLFLNSLGCDLSMWDAQARELAGRFRVIRFDARGHGASDAPDGDYTLDRLGRDALAVLDAVVGVGKAGAERAHICGLSLGGVTAQWLAIHAPAHVNRLILANTAGRVGTAESWQARLDTVKSHGMTAIADAVMGRFFCDAFRAAHPDTVETFRHILLRTAPQGYAGCCAALRDADLSQELGRIRAPTLVIGGRLDASTPQAQAEALAHGIEGARLSLLDAAHLSNIEQPAAFIAAVMKHLESA
jgi:3-oxoadipate enol-lactonase